jgi:hypothetical protein
VADVGGIYKIRGTSGKKKVITVKNETIKIKKISYDIN